MYRAFIFLLLFSFTISFSKDGYREGKVKGQYIFHGSSYSVFVDSSAVSFVYYSNSHSSKEGLTIITRVDLLLDKSEILPETPTGYERLNLNGQNEDRAVFEQIRARTASSEIILFGEEFSISSRDRNFDLTFSGASAIVKREDELFFLVEDKLYPIYLSFKDLMDFSELSFHVNLPVITGESNLSHRWSTFIGGTVDDDIQSVVKAGNLVFACGSTLSNDLPATIGSFQDTLGGYYDCYISCYTPEGQKRWTSYLGGSNLEIANSLAGDSLGNLIVGGYTNSPDFPIVNSGSSVLSGSYDGFIAKFDSSGNLTYSGFFGGSAGDFIYAIAKDNAGNLYIGGGTTSQNLPVNGSSVQPNHAGAIDAYVAKFNQSMQLKWCTYMGGSGSEDMHAMTTDNSSSVIFCGGTYSLDFPSVDPLQPFTSGGADVYITKLDSSGNIIFSTYYGGTGHDDAFGIVSDSLKNIYVAGYTPSTDLVFAGNNYQNENNGGFDNFIIKVSPTGEFMKGTYYGGSTDDQLVDLAFGDNKVFLAGFTSSTDLPVSTDAAQQTNNGLLDAYFAVFDTSLSFIASSYFGGQATERTYSIEFDSSGTIYLAGKTSSPELPFVTFGYQQVNNGGEDGFIARLNYINEPTLVKEQRELTKVLIYPQPSTNELNIEAPEFIVRFEIFEVSGKVLKSGNINERFSVIDVSKLSHGTYILTLYLVSGLSSNHIFVKD